MKRFHQNINTSGDWGTVGL